MEEKHITSLIEYQKKQREFVRKGRFRLVFLAIVLFCLWLIPRQRGFSAEEGRLWDDVRQAEIFLWEW